MAERTQGKPERSLPVDTGRGASGSAPTAPHATSGAAGRRLSGPERFWSAPAARFIAVACVCLSLAVHYVLAPWSLLPEHNFEIHDTAGDLAIPIDILSGEANEPPPAPPPNPAPPAVPPPNVDKGEGLDGGVSARRDAGQTRPPRDGGPDAPHPVRHVDAGTPGDAAARSAEAGGGTGVHADAAVARAGQASGTVRDAVGMIGAAGAAQAGAQNVVLVVNMAVIRTHPVGARIGPLFAAIPQWDDFLVGTGIDPLRDTDWLSINGPALIHTEKDVILVHYSASDAVVDHALESIGRKTGNGGPYDAGVPGLKATLGHADRADRVFMRPQPHVVAVVPPYYAATAARMLSRATITRAAKRPTEAMRLTLVHPHGPMPLIPEAVTEARVWVVPRSSDGGADIYGEGDTASPEVCRHSVDTLKALVREQNSFGVKLVTHGLLDALALTADGSTVRMHLPVSRDQLELILAFAAGRLGVDITPPDGGAAVPARPR